MKKRLLSLALALCLVCSLLPGTALAAGENPFTDVPASHWAHDDITYVYENDLMNGTDGSLFSPESTTTRAQVVTVLYRLAGQPAADWANPFWDVPASAWFHDAVTWAWENDITGGVSSTHFGAGNAVTREQLATFLYRYAQDQGYDTSARADLSGYSDAGLVSSYATEALSWANATGLIIGTTATTLSPKGSATRAQVATILSRFCQDVIPGGYVSPAHMIRNLEDSTLSKKDTLVAMAEVLLDDGFAPAFVAGILGNIMVEGDCGRFESSAYISNPDAEPDYLVYLDENYDYREKYSYKLIYEGISLQEVYNMILELGPGGANGRGSCFGLGCLQWTSYERIKRLVENYIEAADGADTITLAQVQEAEGMTVSYELNNTYRSVYTTWQSENADQNTTEAAFAAGVIVCVRYGVPVGYNTEEVQNTRGALAEAVYNVMMGNS
ncbi:phage tail tip lysozyme [Evtepia sp.]|uniref:phage tail tip lysozyme n=1 Tax=Evtepia sp. TaxID=2773933 RepID=UPI002E77B630|nr:phage tail tip lysozyme [Evtepia sp.]MEE0747805.1 phage tail tip lysozyme [Evtepia sp.]